MPQTAKCTATPNVLSRTRLAAAAARAPCGCSGCAAGAAVPRVPGAPPRRAGVGGTTCRRGSEHGRACGVAGAPLPLGVSRPARAREPQLVRIREVDLAGALACKLARRAAVEFPENFRGGPADDREGAQSARARRFDRSCKQAGPPKPGGWPCRAAAGRAAGLRPPRAGGAHPRPSSRGCGRPGGRRPRGAPRARRARRPSRARTGAPAAARSSAAAAAPCSAAPARAQAAMSRRALVVLCTCDTRIERATGYQSPKGAL